MSSPLLEVRDVTKRYGSLEVVRAVSFAVADGEALGILGPNGAGKTTLFNLITGDVLADDGTVVLEGQDVSRMRPHVRCRMGIGRSYQIAQPFAGLTVFENVLVAGLFGAGLSRADAGALALDVLERTALLQHANRLGGTLTLLQRKRLELARALATRPRILLLDEIAGGLTDREAATLVGLLGSIRASGVTIVWIEHVVHALIAVATRLIVLDSGAVLAQGEPRAVIASADVQRVYMGIEA